MTLRKFFNILFSLIISFSLLSIANSALAVDNHASSVHQGKYPTYPKINYGTGAKAKQLKRGEY